MMAKKYYAVKSGKNIGIFSTWDECKKQVHGFPGALYKSFPSLIEAEQYLKSNEARTVKQEDTVSGHHIYVDGSYLNKQYSWGFAVYLDDTLIHTDKGIGENLAAAALHNVAGELEAVIKAVEWAKNNRIDYIVIHHDYIGISEWAEGRWKTNNDITKQYAALMANELDWIRFKKVSGHTGIEGNELADKLAKSALGIN